MSHRLPRRPRPPSPGTARPYLPDMVADQVLQQLLLELLQAGVQREEHVVQVPWDTLLKTRLPEGIT